VENIEVKHLSNVIERQGKLLEQIAKAVERSNEILFELLSEEQRSSLSKKSTAKAVAQISKSQTERR